MNDAITYEAGEDLSFEFTAEKDQVIWGRYFEFGDVIIVRLNQRLTPNDLYYNMGRGGPWGWGAFTTRWIESIADRVFSLNDNSIVYKNTRPARHPNERRWESNVSFTESYLRPQ